MEPASRRQLSRRELSLALLASALLVAVALSASIRHSVLCDSGLSEDGEAAATLARQSLDARLLGVEQEAMENLLVVRRVVELLDGRFRSTDRALDALDGGAGPAPGHPAAPFAELYADAEKLAAEIDAAFDRADDDAFGRGARAPRGDGRARPAGDDWARPAGDDWERPPAGGGLAGLGDDRRGGGLGVDDAARLDDFAALRDASHVLDDVAPRGAPPDDAAASARCGEIQAEYGVLPSVSWGSAPPDAQREWRGLDCDARV